MPDEATVVTKVAQSLGDRMNDYGWATWLWVSSFSIAGGVASFFMKLKRGEVRIFNLVELAGELFISWFVGVVTFLLCEGYGLDPIYSAGLIGVTAHMGSRALYLAEKALARSVERRLGVEQTNTAANAANAEGEA